MSAWLEAIPIVGQLLGKTIDLVDQAVTDKDKANWTTYWYGLSVMITDSAQLDINGMFDTSSYPDRGYPYAAQIFDLAFFENLAISLKYIFW